MKYRFLVKDLDGFTHSIERECETEAAAVKVAKSMCSDVYFVVSVTLYLMLSQDSCGPIRYVEYFTYGDL